MANPNKTVGKWRKRVGFPVPELRRDTIEFSSRVDFLVKNKPDWTEAQIKTFLETGQKPT